MKYIICATLAAASLAFQPALLLRSVFILEMSLLELPSGYIAFVVRDTIVIAGVYISFIVHYTLCTCRDMQDCSTLTCNENLVYCRLPAWCQTPLWRKGQTRQAMERSAA